MVNCKYDSRWPHTAAIHAAGCLILELDCGPGPQSVIFVECLGLTWLFLVFLRRYDRMTSIEIGVSTMKPKFFKPISEETIDAKRFIELTTDKYHNIERVTFVPPKIGKHGFGYFRVKYNTPVLKENSPRG